MSEPAENAADIRAGDLREGLVTWTTVDSPWLHLIDYTLFANTLERIRDMTPTVILSSHLPVASGMNEELLGLVASARLANPFVGLDQPGLEALLRQLAAK